MNFLYRIALSIILLTTIPLYASELGVKLYPPTKFTLTTHSISKPFTKPANDIANALKITINDGLYIYRQPLSWQRPQRIQAAKLLAIGGLIYAFDKEIHDLFLRNKDAYPLKIVHEVGEFFEPLGYMGFTNKYYAAGLLFGYFFGWDEVLSLSADIVESYLIFGGIKNAANFVVGRKRPGAHMGSRSYSLNDGTSFPSGHSSNIVQIANVVTYHYDTLPVRITAYTIAGAVCIQRITSEAHWPSDVYFGALLGWVVSRELIQLKQDRQLKVTPQIGADGAILTLSLKL